MDHCGPKTQAQLEQMLETRFETATLLLECQHTAQEVQADLGLAMHSQALGAQECHRENCLQAATGFLWQTI